MLFYFCGTTFAETAQYTKTVDRVVRSDWLVKLRISFAIYLRATWEKLAFQFASVTLAKKSSKLSFCAMCYLTVLVYTKTTIHLSVSS